MENYLPTFDEFMNESDNQLNENYIPVATNLHNKGMDFYVEMAKLFDMFTKSRMSSVAKQLYSDVRSIDELAIVDNGHVSLVNHVGKLSLHLIIDNNNPKQLDVYFELPDSGLYDYYSGHVMNLENYSKKDLSALRELSKMVNDKRTVRQIDELI